jgi:bifunctional DNase/RNase
MRSVVESLGAEVERVDVTELHEGTFFAELVLSIDGEAVRISSRPSDAVALATRTGAAVYAAKDLLDEAGVEIHDDQEEAEIERFREFLDDVSPEDFEGGATS